jgi:hypothetical protein
MGANTKKKNRKRSDAPSIRIPRASLSFSIVSNGPPDTVADNCPLSFQVKLKESSLTQPGVSVNLQKKGEIYVIKILSTEIGALNPQRSKMVEMCRGVGVNYLGKVIQEKDSTYARFTQAAQ